ALQALAHNASGSVRGRVLIVDAQGLVLADSSGPAQLGTSYASRPEIHTALSGRQYQVTRGSQTLGQEILATAVPIVHDAQTAGAVRITQSIGAVHSAVRRAQFVGPIGRLEQVARRVAQGDLTARAEVEGSTEQRSLAASFNEMTGRIEGLLAAQRD